MTPEKRAYMKKYREDNLEHLKEKSRKYYYDHHEERKAYNREYYQKMKANMTEEDIEERRAYQRMMYKIYRERQKDKVYGRGQSSKKP